MKPLMLVAFLFVSIASFSQNNYLEITKIGSEKTKVFKENNRVIITDKNGNKIKGRLNFMDASNLIVNENQVTITNIAEIKRNQLFYSISYITLGSLSILTAGVLVLPLLITQASLFPIVAILGGTYTYIFTTSLLKKKFDSDKWSFKIVLDE